MSIWEYMESPEYKARITEMAVELRDSFRNAAAKFAQCTPEQAGRVIQFIGIVASLDNAVVKAAEEKSKKK